MGQALTGAAQDEGWVLIVMILLLKIWIVLAVVAVSIQAWVYVTRVLIEFFRNDGGNVQ